MAARTLLIAAGAFVAFGLTPAMAGSGCPFGGHADKPATVVDADQSTPADTQTYSSIPYPLPTLDEDTQTAAVEDDKTTTTE